MTVRERVSGMARRHRFACLKAVVLCALTALIIGCFVQQKSVSRQNVRIEALRAQRDALIEANALLREQIAFTDTDTYLRREAHRQGYVADDEILFVLD